MVSSKAPTHRLRRRTSHGLSGSTYVGRGSSRAMEVKTHLMRFLERSVFRPEMARAHRPRVCLALRLTPSSLLVSCYVRRSCPTRLPFRWTRRWTMAKEEQAACEPTERHIIRITAKEKGKVVTA